MLRPATCLIAVSLFALLTVATPIQTLAQDDEQARIRVLVQQFFAAYSKEDIEGLMSLWSDKSDLKASRETFLTTFQDLQNINVKSLDISKITIGSDEAKVLLKVELSAVDAKTGKPAELFIKENRNRTLYLSRQQQRWKVRQYIATEEELADALIAINTEAERRALFDANKDLHTRVLMKALRRERFSSSGNLAQGLHVWRLFLELAERLEEKESNAVAWHIIGVIQYAQGDLPAALEDYQKAAKLYEILDDKERFAALLLDIGQIEHARAEYSHAHDSFKKALALSEALGDKKRITLGLNSIGAIYAAQGDYLTALDYYQKSLAICEEIKYEPMMPTPLMNIGSTYRIMGNNALALQYYQRSLQLIEPYNDKRRTASVLNNIGEIHQSQGNYSQALDYSQKALAMVQEVGHKADVPLYEQQIGSIHLARRDYALALAHFEKSLSLNESLGQRAMIVIALQNIGNVHQLEGRNDRALEYFQRSLRLAEELKEPSLIAAAHVGLSTIYLAQGKSETALASAELALALASKMQRADVLWASHNLIGQAQRVLGRVDLARRSFDAAIEEIEKMRATLAGGEQESHRFLEDKLAPYYSMIELLIASNNFAEALSYAERAKARTLLDVLSSGRVNVTKAMTKEEDERERALHAQIVTLNSQLFQIDRKPDDARSTVLKAKLEKARLEYEAFQANLYTAHPELKVQRGQSRVFTIAEAGAILPDNRTAILEYVVTEKNTYLFVIARVAGQTAVTAYPLGLRNDEVGKATENFREQVATRDLTFETSARRLYDQLVKPAEKQLRGINKLIIVPDGQLWDLPFQALRRDEDYVLDDFVVSYAPSLSVLREMKTKTHAKTPEVLLALGNPDLNVNEVAQLSLLRAEDFGPIQSSETEVNTLGQLYGRHHSKILVGKSATEEEAKGEAEKYRLLHFATHAVLDDRNPMYSRIMLSRDEQREDGMLEAWELMKMNLTAEMVVLSACQTARGRVGAGEGMIGMSWALFVAGSPTVVVSQWKVDSDRTSELMIDFHRNLVRGAARRGAMTKAEALRLAALKLRRSRYSHPFYWAGFVLIGNER
jgi:CHAT domain-containing protein/tetratricopeptide (TPR) repeat protein